VVVEVRDAGRGSGGRAPDHGAGHGLRGMRERVALYGGELDAGPHADGGFAVRARFPLDAAA
jgi:signal transduction histidine kinase